MSPDQRDVVEDPEPEVDERDEVQVQPEPVSDEREDHGHERVDDEPADKDPIVVDPVELRADRPEDRIERGEDRHGRVSAELETDGHVEDEPEQDAHEEACQG